MSETVTIGQHEMTLNATFTNGKCCCYLDSANNYKRIRFGTNATGHVNPLTLTSDFSNYVVKKVSVYSSTVTNGSIKLNVTVGEVPYITNHVVDYAIGAIASTGGECSGVGTSSGNLVITFSNVVDETYDTLNLYKIEIEYVDKE